MNASCEHERHTHRRSAGPLSGGEPRDIDERWGQSSAKGWTGGLDGIEDRVALMLKSGLLLRRGLAGDHARVVATAKLEPELECLPGFAPVLHIPKQVPPDGGECRLDTCKRHGEIELWCFGRQHLI